MQTQDTILITGSTGMIGSAVVRLLQNTQAKLLTPSHQTLDLCQQTAVEHYFAEHKPTHVFHLAALVGGIHANQTYPAKFIYANTQMHCNLIKTAYDFGVKKFLFPGSACTYPKFAPQPISEDAFLDGKMEPTNLAYGAAKINGIVMCQAFAKEYGFNALVTMPTNAYGINDNFNPTASHVIPALMQRFHQAKLSNATEVVLWGTGKALREFIYVDDLADAFLFLMQHYQSAEMINVGTMQEISIEELATEIARVTNFTGKITLDLSKPDGAPRKCLDSSKLFSMGWQPKISLSEGLQRMYQHHFMINPMGAAARA